MTTDFMKRIAAMRFRQANRWAQPGTSDFSRTNAWVALCEAIFWRDRAKRCLG